MQLPEIHRQPQVCTSYAGNHSSIPWLLRFWCFPPQIQALVGVQVVTTGIHLSVRPMFWKDQL